MSTSIFVVAGELSGDAHGAGLLEVLREKHPDLVIQGAGGPQMKQIAGAGLSDWVADAAVMGVWEVLKHYGWFKRRFDELLQQCVALRPQVLLLIDYPGFNLRFAKAVRQQLPQTAIVQYICPQVWAWNRGRIPEMARDLDEMLCLFPFEQQVFAGSGLRTTMVGHPLIDELAAQRIEVTREDNAVGLFPGSREREVVRLFPMMLEAAAQLRQWRGDLQFRAPAASDALSRVMQSMVQQRGMGAVVEVVTAQSHEQMQRVACGVIASGTATLEAACFALPYCLVYRVAWPTYLLGRLLIKIPYIGLVNILAGREVVKEWIQHEATAANVADSLQQLLSDATRRDALAAELRDTAALLGDAGAHRRAAEAVDLWLETGRISALKSDKK